MVVQMSKQRFKLLQLDAVSYNTNQKCVLV